MPVVSNSEYDNRTDRQTDGRTPDHYIKLSARHSQHNNSMLKLNTIYCDLYAQWLKGFLTFFYVECTYKNTFYFHNRMQLNVRTVNYILLQLSCTFL